MTTTNANCLKSSDFSNIFPDCEKTKSEITQVTNTDGSTTSSHTDGDGGPVVSWTTGGPSVADIYVDGGTLNPTTNILTLNDTDAATPDVNIDLTPLVATADNGLNISTDGDVELGGTLNKDTTITQAGFDVNLTGGEVNIGTVGSDESDLKLIGLDGNTPKKGISTNTILSYNNGTGDVEPFELPKTEEISNPSGLGGLLNGVSETWVLAGTFAGFDTFVWDSPINTNVNSTLPDLGDGLLTNINIEYALDRYTPVDNSQVYIVLNSDGTDIGRTMYTQGNLAGPTRDLYDFMSRSIVTDGTPDLNISFRIQVPTGQETVASLNARGSRTWVRKFVVQYQQIIT